MKRIIVLFTLLLGAALSSAAQGIQFTKGSWAEIKAQALAEDKVIFMDAYTTWCGPCKWLAANVFTDEQVGEVMNANFVNVKFDMEKGEGLAIAKEYNVRAYPTLLFIDGNGDLVHRLCGAQPVEPFLEDINQIVQREDLLIDLAQDYAQQPENKEVIGKFLIALAKGCSSSEGIETSFYTSITDDEMMESYVFEVMQSYPPKLESATFAYLAEHIEAYTITFGPEAKDIITNAVMQTLRPALFAEEEDAYPNAKAAVLEKELPGIDEPILLLDLSYYKRTENWKAYLETATQYIDGYAADNSNALNSIAWTIYESVDDENGIQMGLEWATMAKDLESSYAILDTYAALLFKSGQIEAGQIAAQQAIDAAKAEGTDYSGTEALLEEYVKD